MVELKNPGFKITPSDFGLLGNVSAVFYQSYQIENTWFGLKRKIKGAAFLDIDCHELNFKNYKLESQKGGTGHNDLDKIYIYSENGVLQEIKGFGRNPYTNEIREYQNSVLTHPNENTLEVNTYIGYDRNHSKSVFSSNGNCIEEIIYLKDGTSDERKLFNFQENGLLLSETEYKIYRGEEAFENPDTFESFVETDSWIAGRQPFNKAFEEPTADFAEGDEYQSYMTTYAYSNNFLIEESYFHGDEEQYKIIFHNDDRGNPILNINYEEDEIVEFKKFEYKYDQFGNWIIRKEYEVEQWKSDDFMNHKAILKYIVNRKITYFD
ncbi:MAG: hypothetical protein EOO45_11380 [Flavobacterium sp.]|nr:MAG: hypothetical protein EOO45_11380 [Flavobacterium sp.]